MDIRFITGDVRTAQNGLLVQGVNCQSAMGSGVAAAIMSTWPEVSVAYHKYCEIHEGETILGTCNYVKVTPELTVVNGFTQEYFGSDGKRYACPKAILSVLRECCAFLMYKDPEDRQLHMPRIASDLGGLDWETEVLPVVEKVAREYPKVTITVYTLA